MSVVCAAMKNGIVAISSDTQTNYGSLKVPAKHLRNIKKLFPINKSVVGIVGWVAISDMMEHLFINDKKLFELNSRMEIYGTLLRLHETMKKDYFIETNEDDDQPVESSQLDALIVNKNGIFEINSYREVNEYKTFWAIGSGRRIGLGAMHALYDSKASAKQIVEAGVRAATEFDDSCGLPLKTKTISLLKK